MLGILLSSVVFSVVFSVVVSAVAAGRFRGVPCGPVGFILELGLGLRVLRRGVPVPLPLRSAPRARALEQVKDFKVRLAVWAWRARELLQANVSGHYRLRSSYDRALTAQSVEKRATRKTGC